MSDAYLATKGRMIAFDRIMETLDGLGPDCRLLLGDYEGPLEDVQTISGFLMNGQRVTLVFSTALTRTKF